MRYYKTKWAAYNSKRPEETAIQDGNRWVVLSPAEHEAYRRNLNQKAGGTAAGDRRELASKHTEGKGLKERT